MKEIIHDLWTNPASARKFFVALAGALVVIAANGLLPPTIAVWVTVLGPLVTAGGVYAVRNDDGTTDTGM